MRSLVDLSNLSAEPVHFTVPIWGEEYVRDFLAYSLPCQLANGNIPTLAEQGLMLNYHIVTDTAGKKQIEKHPTYQALTHFATVFFHALEDVTRQVANKRNEWLRYPEANWLKYAIKMEALAIGVRAAAREEGAFVPLMSDIIISNSALSHAIESYLHGAKLVLVGGPRIQKTAFLQEIKGLVAENNLPISGELLQDIIVNHIHPFSLKQAVDSEFFNPLWPDYLYWFKQGNVLIQQGVYCFPLVIGMKEPLTFLPGYTIDTMPFDFDDEDICVVTNTNKCCVASIDDADYELGEKGRFNPKDVAFFMLKHAQSHHRFFSQHQVIYSKKSGETDNNLLAKAKEDFNKINAHLDLLQTNQQCYLNEQLNVLLRTKSKSWRENCLVKCLAKIKQSKKVVLMGASTEAEILILASKHPNNLAYVLDNDPKWHQCEFNSVKVLPPESLTRRDLATDIDVIILTSERHAQVMGQQINNILDNNVMKQNAPSQTIEVFNPYE